MNCEFAYDLPYSRKSKFSLIPGAGSNNKRHSTTHYFPPKCSESNEFYQQNRMVVSIRIVFRMFALEDGYLVSFMETLKLNFTLQVKLFS